MTLLPVVLYYDHIITLSMEIARIWSRPLSKPALWFFLNRYLPFFGHIVVVVFILGGVTPDDTSCQAYVLFHQFMLIFNQVVVAVLLILRTYAFYGKSRSILAALSLILLAAIILACWTSITHNISIVVSGNPIRGCHSGLSYESGVYIAIAWEAQAVFDVVVFALTLYKSYQHQRDLECSLGSKEAGSGKVGLVELFIRDGAVYFG
ncbi:hypothetical protein HETIRDRAFT_446792 [Heterobasidion irregulare TC 32-1]|uniref:DUF6533 domain-containing protein n=1 Tax=Heterobasidion irregulare (strain TC 32-1) TaxID=747525 RepID=W4JSJ0_HETIT|nr:uncharacterized protein HETIRDRAFT_446792 [Heterobasidion irregulare TC 32-1]ETW76080.1 hypothetical protein HETIRDRAFT_446792 [Heterobasidion irregulare TC 32-1]